MQSMRPFWIVWTGQAFSLLGSQMVQFALVWWLTRTTGSATVLAFATLMALLPQILLSPFAGAIVDRQSRRRIMIVADAGIALVTLVLIACFWLNVASVWIVYAVLLVRSAGGAFHWPAMQASTILMVPQKHLSRVAGFNQTLAGIASVFIPPLGAVAVEALPMQTVLSVDVVTAAIAITPLFFIAIPQPVRTGSAAGTKTTMLADMREGLLYIVSWRGLLLFTILGTVIRLLGGAAGSLRPLLVTQRFGGGALEIGWLRSAEGIGAIIGGTLLGVWGGFRRRIVTMMLALILDGIVIAVAALAPADAFLLAVGMIFAMGLLETIVMGTGGAAGQAIIPPEIQGRVFSLISSAGFALAPVGLIVAGPVSDALGVQFWWLITGLVITAMGVFGLLVPDIVNIESHAAEHTLATPAPAGAPGPEPVAARTELPG